MSLINDSIKNPRKHLFEPLMYELYQRIAGQNTRIKEVEKEFELSDFTFGKYILNSDSFGDNFFKLAEFLSSEDKKRLLSNIINTAIIYKSEGKVKSNELYDDTYKKAISGLSDYLTRKKNNGDCFEIDGYKLPIDYFLGEVCFEKLSIDKMNTKYFENKDIIDVGACLGDSSVILADYTNKNVYAFEPLQSNIDLMKKTIELNNKKNIVPVRYGLSDEHSTAYVANEDANNIGATGITKDSSKSSEAIDLITLDEYVEKNNLDVGLIKADIEGLEQKLLLGAKKTIEKFKPTLSICIYHSPNDFFNIVPMIDSWNLGYKFKYVPAFSLGHFIAETIITAEIEQY